MLKKTTYWVSVVVIGAVLGLSIQLVLAWQEPTVAPPDANLGAPINTGGIDQIKDGKITALDVCTSSGKCLSDSSGGGLSNTDIGALFYLRSGGSTTICCDVNDTRIACSNGSAPDDSGSHPVSPNCCAGYPSTYTWCFDSYTDATCTDPSGGTYLPGGTYTVPGACVAIEPKASNCGACVFGSRWCNRQKPTTIFTCQSSGDFDGGSPGATLPCSAGFVSPC